MLAPLDIFAVNSGEPKWLGCAETLAQATEMPRKASSGSYFVFSHKFSSPARQFRAALENVGESRALDSTVFVFS